MPETSTERYESISRILEKNTGKSLVHWMEVVKKSGPKDKKYKEEWLRTKHKLSSRLAKMIVKKLYEGMPGVDIDDLMIPHFNGNKDYQKAMYEKIVTALKRWGEHKIAINKTYVSLFHRHQFAILKTTKEGMIIGVPAAGVKAARNKEFRPAKNLGSEKITHKIVVNDVTDLSDGVMRVLKASYEKS